jgi:hypothetical protein
MKVRYANITARGMAGLLSPRSICFQVEHTECSHSVREVMTRCSKVEVFVYSLATDSNKYSIRHLLQQCVFTGVIIIGGVVALCLGGSLRRVKGHVIKVTLRLSPCTPQDHRAVTHLETSQGLQRIERVAVYAYVGHVNCFENDGCKRCGAEG